MFGYRCKLAQRTILMVCLPLLSGCAMLFAEPAPPPVYYVLTAVPQAEAAQAIGSRPHHRVSAGLVVGVAPISVPDYLDVPQIVTRTTPNTLDRAEAHHWAASLAENFAEVLAENLGVMIPTNRVIVLPSGPLLRTDVQVSVTITKFERDADGFVTLIARWALFGDDGATLMTMRRSIVREPAPVDDFDAIVAAMSKTAAQLSSEIADAIAAPPRAGV